MSRIDAVKFEALAKTLSGALSGSQYFIGGYSGPSLVKGISGGETLSNPNSASVKESTSQISQDQDAFVEIQKMLDDFIKKNNLQGTVSHYIDERGLVVSLNNAALFDSGSADLHSSQKTTVKKIGTMLKKLPNYIRIEGHTDNRPINNPQFPSNWELSVLRATSVVQVLIKDVKIAPDKVSVVGYGEYRPIIPNNSDANMKLNRRVDIVIMKAEYNKWEPTLKGTAKSTGNIK